MDKQAIFDLIYNRAFNSRNIILLIIPIILYTISTSCTNNTIPVNEYELIKTDSFTIPCNKTFPDIMYANSWDFSSNSFSYEVMDNDIFIYSYNFDEKSWSSTNLSLFNDERIEYPGPFSYINDSIILYAVIMKNELLQINLNQKLVQKKYRLSDDYNVKIKANIKPYINNSIIILPAIYTHEMNSSYTDKAKLSMCINRESGEITYHGPFPPGFKMNENTRSTKIFPEMIIHADNIIMSFKCEEQLYNFSLKDSSFKTILCKDKFVKDHNNNLSTGDKLKDALKEELTGMYKVFTYDKDDSLYYRISMAYPGYKGGQPEFGKEVNKILTTMQITVSVLDKNLKLLTQDILKGVSIVNYLARDGKLYLRKDISKPDEITFIGFELVKKQKI